MNIVERRVFSQNGEDGVIESVFQQIGTTNKFFVEIGCEDGRECNSRKLSDIDGWNGIKIDNNNFDPAKSLFKYTVTSDNVCDIFRQLQVPTDLDLLSIDIDFNDFHVLYSTLRQFSPRLIVCEYNSSLGPTADKVVPYLPNSYWDRTDYFGASFQAIANLARHFNYEVVYCESQGVNIFLVRSDLAGEANDKPSLHFRPPGYGGGYGHPKDPKNREYLTSNHYLLEGARTAQTKYGVINYFEFDKYIGASFSNGAYWDEHTVNEVARRLVYCSGTALDVGAHIGSHAVALASLVPNLSFVCFEPQKPVFLLLERNIAENLLQSRVTAINASVAHVPGILSLSKNVFSEEEMADQRLDYHAESSINLGGVQIGVGGQPCETVRLDDLAYPQVVYMKIDVEGAEPLAFFGSRNLIERDLPLILFEDRDDRRLSNETLDALSVDEQIRGFSPALFLRSLDYSIEKLDADYIAVPPSRDGNSLKD